MAELYSVGEAARLVRLSPTTLSRWFYSGKLRDDLAPVIGGRRLVMGLYLPELRRLAELHRQHARERLAKAKQRSASVA